MISIQMYDINQEVRYQFQKYDINPDVGIRFQSRSTISIQNYNTISKGIYLVVKDNCNVCNLILLILALIYESRTYYGAGR